MASTRAAAEVLKPNVLDFVRTALAQDQLTGICKMLESAVGVMQAWGSFLWHAAEYNDSPVDVPEGTLFVLAEWFPGGHTWAFENLELDSVAGKVALSGQAENVEDARNDSRVGRSLKWWIEKNGVTAFCAVPVRFTDGAKAALSFYRTGGNPFTADEVRRAGGIAGLFPSLYESIRNKVSFDLLRRIDGKTVGNPSVDEEIVRRTLREICDLVSATFSCFETSIFLEDRLKLPGVFQQVATTWPADETRQTREYTLEDSGITPWVLRNAQPVRVSNLGLYKAGDAIHPERYPGMIWKDELELASSIAAHKNTTTQELPPLSYIAAPVIAVGKVVGAVRCCAREEPPHYFAERELRLLQLVAAGVGHYWDNLMRGREAVAETRAWELFIDEIRTLNTQISEHLNRPLLDERAIDEACKTVSEKAGAKSMVDLVKQQQKLYLLLCETIRSRSDAEAALLSRAETEKQLYQDLFHQLKSPVFVASATARAAIGRPVSRDESEYRSNLLVLRGQLLKAEQVTRAVQLFAELAKGNKPQAELAPLDYHTMIRSVIWAAEDHERLFDDKRLKFVVERNGFAVIRNHLVNADATLVLHALNNVLDNAGKYSYSSTTVRVFAGLTGAGKFHISVANRGLRLRPGESTQCLQRGWRSAEARMVTGEGSGLGLWIVDRIMEAHSGQVLVLSPNSDDEFEVKLLFHYSK